MRDATGNFRQAVCSALGNAPEWIEFDQMHRFPTSTHASNQAGWCKLFLDGRAGVYGDHRIGLSGVWVAKLTKPPTLAQRQQHATELRLTRDDAAAAQAVQWTIAASKNAVMWAQGFPINGGDPVAQYLDSRGIRLDAWPVALRYNPGLDYWHDGRSMGWHPAMLGAVTDPTGKLVSVHRTYLTQDGRKADLPVVK